MLSISSPRWQLAAWCLFYLGLLGAWGALILIGGEAGDGLLARCLAPVGTLTPASLFPAWALMALGMMLPTSLPTLQRYAILVQGRDGSPLMRFWLFILGYSLVWLGFAALASLAQLLLARLPLVGRLPAAGQPYLAALLLLMAGLYQFSRWKNACLIRCRHPMTFFMAHWRDGYRGAVRMGARHGMDCLGCCWALMSLSLIGGLMNVGFMLLGMILMALEKLAGPGRFVTIPLGLALVAAAFFYGGGIWFAGQP
ncbi:DUF2182 domain-containing protein [Dongia sp.]|uniref:DUF2182 domain-containing protein n=1 Tax=Dongia sp. TaxID=1977262 RepID=UPI0035AE7A5A